MIQQLLYKYLVLNGQLGLPDIGSFTIHRQPATVDASGAILLPPAQQLWFEAKPVQADKNLFLFLAQETDTDEITVIGQFNEWVKTTKEKLTEQSIAELPFMGSLRVTGEGAYLFDALPGGLAQPTVDLPQGMLWQKAITEDGAEEETKDSGWWIYAIILLLLGIAAIAYRYL